MSLTKEQMAYEEEMYSNAKEILINMGEIKPCDCGNICYQLYKYDEKNLYAIATNKLKEKYGNQYEYKTFHNAIKQVLADAHTENDCQFCSFEE